MTIITPEINSRIEQIARMEGTSGEIEYAMKMLCLDVASKVMKHSTDKMLDTLSFESLRKRLYPMPNNLTEYDDETLMNSSDSKESVIL